MQFLRLCKLSLENLTIFTYVYINIKIREICM